MATTGILISQTTILLVMMLCGYIAFKREWISVSGWQSLNKITVNIFNPFFMISLLSSYAGNTGPSISENLILVIIYYIFLIIFGALYVRVRGLKDQDMRLQQLMMVFSNVGFMGAPIVRAMYGGEYLIFLAFYSLAFNILIYTYGVMLASPAGLKFDLKKIINGGTIGCVIAILLYALDIRLPAAAVSLCGYLGNACVPLSMMIIGCTLAQKDLKKVFTAKENYIISFSKLVIIPALGIVLSRFLQFDKTLVGIFVLVLCMPIGSIVGSLAEVYGNAGNKCNDIVAMNTVLSVLTIPVVFYFF